MLGTEVNNPWTLPSRSSHSSSGDGPGVSAVMESMDTGEEHPAPVRVLALETQGLS